MKPLVGILMGSSSDWPIMEKAAKFLDNMEIPFEIHALSAHRTPDQVKAFASSAADNGIKVIIAGAGGAAHLPGFLAAFTHLPIIGVPCRSSISLDG
ncbi:MAG: 5-(carboxyamino)imidazole ribonucleotide mutase, partial [Bacteroidetes bacterium HGW-Bacteroidetes-21]